MFDCSSKMGKHIFFIKRFLAPAPRKNVFLEFLRLKKIPFSTKICIKRFLAPAARTNFFHDFLRLKKIPFHTFSCLFWGHNKKLKYFLFLIFLGGIVL